MSHETPGQASAVAQRMDALGRLAGGVAHDFNNVLMVIGGYAEMLAQSVGDEDSKEAVHTILDAAARAGALTRQLLLFSRRHAIDAADVAIAPAVLAVEARLRVLVPGDVRLAITADDPRLVARVDPDQLDQVVVTLVTTARDAMPDGGQLTVIVQGVHREGFVDASGERAPEGDYVCLSVSDTGAGMDDAVRARIFEPFFPTGAGPKGTGLGLATVYGIVKGSGGFVDVVSAPGRGTTFHVFLPLADVPVVDAVVVEVALP